MSFNPPVANAEDALAASITRASSRQAYYIVRYLVDRDLIADAYRAYAYFRWVDDELDERRMERSERMAFVARESTLINRCYREDWPQPASNEEAMLVDLIRADRRPQSGLQLYLRHMMAVMEFDAERRGRLISEDELSLYTRHLATAVTEALHHFIGCGCPSPKGDIRYLAASGAHVVHMLRDTREDVLNGYFNVPREYLEAQHLDPCDVGSDPYRKWIRSRVQLAQTFFHAGRDYLGQVVNPRCRLAGFAYIARFEVILEAIVRDGFQLRADYADCHALTAAARIMASSLWLALSPRRLTTAPRVLQAR